MRRAYSTVLSAAVIIIGLASLPRTANADNPVSVKDWIYQTDGSGDAEAWTVNESGSQLGVLCYRSSGCIAYFVSESGTCDDGSKYPAIMNSSSGAITLTTICKLIQSGTNKPRYVLVINEFSAVLDSMLKDHVLGIVIPMANGSFSVARFSLEGSNEALAAVNRAIGSQSKTANKLGDQIL